MPVDEVEVAIINIKIDTTTNSDNYCQRSGCNNKYCNSNYSIKYNTNNHNGENHSNNNNYTPTKSSNSSGNTSQKKN
jgi:hypothetical protein